jgi:hypothetical protein
LKTGSSYSISLSGFTLGKKFNNGVNYFAQDDGTLDLDYGTGFRIGVGNKTGGLDINIERWLIGGDGLPIYGIDGLVIKLTL